MCSLLFLGKIQTVYHIVIQNPCPAIDHQETYVVVKILKERVQSIAKINALIISVYTWQIGN